MHSRNNKLIYIACAVVILYLYVSAGIDLTISVTRSKLLVYHKGDTDVVNQIIAGHTKSYLRLSIFYAMPCVFLAILGYMYIFRRKCTCQQPSRADNDK
jgi:hypothetical protein